MLNRRQLLLGSLATAANPKAPGFRLVDVTAAAGIDFRHNSGAFGEKYLPETLGAGCAFFDYDNDGWQDILLVNGMDWPGHKRGRSTLRLYRNNRNGAFTDVTRRAGLDVEMYGMGVAMATTITMDSRTCSSPAWDRAGFSRTRAAVPLSMSPNAAAWRAGPASAAPRSGSTTTGTDCSTCSSATT